MFDKFSQKILQEYQYVHTSPVAVTFGEMQQEVNMGRPFESKLYIEYSAEHFSLWNPLSSAFLGILLKGRRSVAVDECYGTLRELYEEFCATDVAVSI